MNIREVSSSILDYSCENFRGKDQWSHVTAFALLYLKRHTQIRNKFIIIIMNGPTAQMASSCMAAFFQSPTPGKTDHSLTSAAEVKTV
jgi:hypothetical protein